MQKLNKAMYYLTRSTRLPADHMTSSSHSWTQSSFKRRLVFLPKARQLANPQLGSPEMNIWIQNISHLPKLFGTLNAYKIDHLTTSRPISSQAPSLSTHLMTSTNLQTKLFGTGSGGTGFPQETELLRKHSSPDRTDHSLRSTHCPSAQLGRTKVSNPKRSEVPDPFQAQVDFHLLVSPCLPGVSLSHRGGCFVSVEG